MASYERTETSEKLTSCYLLPYASILCMENARGACTREESLSWIKPGTKILAKWCQDAEREGGSKDILRLLFSLYKSSCKDILEEKEDAE